MMAKIKVRCTNCGKELETDDAKDADICPLCQNAYIVRDAIRRMGGAGPYPSSDREDFHIRTSDRGGVKKIILDRYTGKEQNPVIPNGVMIIGDDAFKYRADLTGVTMPDSVTHIYTSAFKGCDALKNIKLSGELISVGNFAFERCERLSEIRLPDTVTKIWGAAFQDCVSLREINLPGSLDRLGRKAFKGCKSLKEIALSPNIREIHSRTFKSCTALERVVIPEGVTRIGTFAFEGCTGLTELEIPSSMIMIENFAFKDCESLSRVTIRSAETILGMDAFYKCHKISEINASLKWLWKNRKKFDCLRRKSQLWWLRRFWSVRDTGNNQT